jgi:hypothetical protein
VPEAESDVSLGLVVDAELFRLDAVVRWLDAADGRIKREAAEPVLPETTAAGPTPAEMTPAGMTPAQTTGTTQAVPSVRRRLGARK